MGYSFGRRGYGRGRFGGDHPFDIGVPESGQGLPSMVANDRHQLVVLPERGERGVVPIWRQWFGGAPEWGDVVGARRRSQLVPFHALDEHANPVVGIVEFPVIDIGAGAEATISGVLVAFEARPTAIGGFDGNIDMSEPIGFSVYVEGHGHPFAVDLISGTRVSGTIRSEPIAYELDADTVDASRWPNRMTVFVPCRLDQRVRGIRAGIVNIRHCRIVWAIPMGTKVASEEP